MLRNYFLVAYRTLLRYKGYTLLNVIGLTLGLTCGILIFQTLKFQTSFDAYHAQKDRIYRVMTEFHGDQVFHTPGVPMPMSKALRADFSFLEKVALIYDQHSQLVTIPQSKGLPQKKFSEESTVAYAEPDLFDILDYQWVTGNPKLSLTQPNNVVLTRKMAEKFFGSEDPIGKRLRINNELDVKVTGILADLPENTRVRQEILISWSTLKNYQNGPGKNLEDWGSINSSTHCFILLREGTKQSTVEQALKGFLKKYKPDDYKEMAHPILSLREVSFNTDYDAEIGYSQLYALGVIGLFLVVTACINFINLATAQALKRSKEVGVRKVIGGTKPQLFWQFISETGLITLISILLAVLLVELIMPTVNHWVHESTGLNLFGSLSLFTDAPMLLFLAFLLVTVTLLSGSYPGIVLAGFQPVAALKGKINTQQVGGLSVRRSLVIVQFVLTQLLIIGAIVVTQQMDFFRGKDIGYNPSAIVLIDIPLPEKATEAFRTQLQRVPGVSQVTFQSHAPSSQSNNETSHRFDTRQENEKWSVNTKLADPHYLETYGLKLVAGKNLPESDSTRGYLVNETYVKRLGKNIKPADVIGRNLKLWNISAPIYGVIKDWNNLSLHSQIQPIAIFSDHKRYYSAGLKVNTAHLPQTLAGIEQVWNETFPDFLYSQYFLDERIAKFYQTENLILQFVRVFSCIAIIIGCLGLYGLVSFMAAQKTKEIGVRKVLGASVSQILGLFGMEFGKLVLIAFVVAAPLSWWVMTKWLEDYSYRISIGWTVFVLAIVITAFIAILTVGYQSFRAATANPAKSLKSE
ncbi:hypothetical protein BWI96_15850 [Siphonobacter sp. SORGH_AS_0500]|uniref:ABC transporter permease n=1 Tax=Siphonobacter sp. SORGH_AS_0500 TaxID=1864824 RepID=UPI000CCB5768|nr:ABC transporter permease [Siphonobacter sp. SORGH_AS_0500]PKK35580.1 hypothetical protein BWI96_15850 [Siphonobacter sp. SORGH_AS_0500]